MNFAFAAKTMIVQAWKIDQHDGAGLPDWTEAALKAGVLEVQQEPFAIKVKSVAGPSKGKPGDWIVRNPGGDLVMVEALVFEAAYKPLAADTTAPEADPDALPVHPDSIHRQIETHKTNECNSALEIFVLDGPGPGNACHKYLISGGKYVNCAIEFQNGAIKEVGTNGVTHEALCAVLIDRLEGFQAGKYACDENAMALEYIREALGILQSRTKRRVVAGIEGTMAPDPVEKKHLGDGTAKATETLSPADAQPKALTEQKK
ncbi:MAG: hypothetical protein WC100_03445 [Sterolibacterium sp.]